MVYGKQLLDPAFSPVVRNQYFLSEIFRDLKDKCNKDTMEGDQFEETMSEVHYQVAVCYYNGWGTDKDREQYVHHLKRALSLRSQRAWLTVRPTLSSYKQMNRHDWLDFDFGFPPVDTEEDHDDCYGKMLQLFPFKADLVKATQLRMVSPEQFQKSLKHSRYFCFEHCNGEREVFTIDLSIWFVLNFQAATESMMNKTTMAGLEHDVEHLGPMEFPFRGVCLAAANGNMLTATELLALLSSREPTFQAATFLNQNRPGSIHGPFGIRTGNRSHPHRPIVFDNLTRPLILACTNGQVEMTKYLLQQGADPRLTDSVGRLALHYLARFDPENVEEIGELLLRDDCDTMLNLVDDDGYSPLAFVLDGEKNFVPTSGLASANFLLRLGASWFSKREMKSQADSINMESMLQAAFVKAVLSWDLRAARLVKRAVLADIKQSRLQVSESAEENRRLIWTSQILTALTTLEVQPRIVRLQKCATYGLDTEDMVRFLVDCAGSDNMRKYISQVVTRLVHLRSSEVLLALSSILPSINLAYQGNEFELLATALSRNDWDITHQLLRLGVRFDRRSWPYGSFNILHIAAMRRSPLSFVKSVCGNHERFVDLKRLVNHPGSLEGSRLSAFDFAVVQGHFTLAEYFATVLGAEKTTAHICVGFKHNETSKFPLDLSQPVIATLLGYVLYSFPNRAPNEPPKTRILRHILTMDPDSMAIPALQMNVFHVCWSMLATKAQDCKSKRPKAIKNKSQALLPSGRDSTTTVKSRKALKV